MGEEGADRELAASGQGKGRKGGGESGGLGGGADPDV